MAGEELDLLVSAFERMRREHRPQLVTVVGVPGIGKSRLVTELFGVAEADPEFITWRRGRSLSYGEGISLWALGEIVKSELGVLESDSREETANKLAESVAELVADDDERGWLESQLAPLVGLPSNPADEPAIMKKRLGPVGPGIDEKKLSQMRNLLANW